MKARVKATGEIVELRQKCDEAYRYYSPDKRELYHALELDFINEEENSDYWEKLKHQYAGMAMQGIIRTVGHNRMYPPEKAAIYAVACATALVEKMKGSF